MSTLPASYNVGGEPVTEVRRYLGRYEICEALGAGAMGVVYHARDPELDRAVAIKLVRSAGRPSAARLLREARAMARLRHPNVVPIFDVGVADGTVFVAMPLLEGGTLRSWLQEAPRTLDAILDHFAAAGRGLVAAHAAGIVHRDFKPDNVLLGADGEVHVADFGLAWLAETVELDDDCPRGPDTATQTGQVMGTPAYMAPEQLAGRPSDARADQFSFCVALWEAVFGARPFASPAPGAEDPLRARLAAINAGPRAFTPRRDRPAWLAGLLRRGLAASAADRWPSLAELLDRIAARRMGWRWSRRLVDLAAVGLIAAGVAAAVAIHLPREAPAALPAPPGYRAEPLARSSGHYAAISPDGKQLAIVDGGQLIIRGVEPGATSRVIADRGIEDDPIAWSPDGKKLLATLPGVPPALGIALIDVATGSQHALPINGFATFLSDRKIAMVSPRQRTVRIVALGAPASHATCDVPGDYTFLWRATGTRDGTLVVETSQGDSHDLVILRPDCRLRATVAGESITSVALSDSDTIIALATGSAGREILEISLDGAVIGRRKVGDDVDEVLGRRSDIDYVARLAPLTRLERLRRGEPPVPAYSVDALASFSLAPDGATLAWIEHRGQASGPLWISSLPDPARGDKLLDNAWRASWSPDGGALAVLIDEPGGPDGRAATRLVLIDRAGTVLRRLPLDRIDRTAAPVWLDDQRVAAQTLDRTTYRWIDLDSGAQGDVVDRAHGSTYCLVRSPRNGALAMWRNGAPDSADPHIDHLWIAEPGQPVRPLRVDGAAQQPLVPSWSPTGELFVRALETGDVSQVSLETGALTRIAVLSRTPTSRSYDNYLMTLAGGEVLAVEIQLHTVILALHRDDPSRPHLRHE